MADRIAFIVGPALAMLVQLERSGQTEFDPVFIDADKTAARRLHQ